MVYGAVTGNQTERYPRIKEHFTTTNEHFHDQPNAKEPNKTSTFGKLYSHSPYFMDRRLEPTTQTRQMAGSPSFKISEATKQLTWSGRLSAHTYQGDGTFMLANGLTYSYRSHKPVKLVPYADLQKTEYQDKICKTGVLSKDALWVSGRAPNSATYKSTGRFKGLSG